MESQSQTDTAHRQTHFQQEKDHNIHTLVPVTTVKLVSEREKRKWKQQKQNKQNFQSRARHCPSVAGIGAVGRVGTVAIHPMDWFPSSLLPNDSPISTTATLSSSTLHANETFVHALALSAAAAAGRRESASRRAGQKEVALSLVSPPSF